MRLRASAGRQRLHLRSTRQIQGLLGRKLRENYEEVVKEAVPDKFLLLLDELKKKEKGGKKDGGS